MNGTSTRTRSRKAAVHRRWMVAMLAAWLLAGLAGPAVVTAAEPFMVAVLPDTQIYARDYPEIFDAQIQYIVDNAAEKNIVFVSHLGDIVDAGSDPVQWSRGKASMGKLDTAGIPYGTALGNHDYIDYELDFPYAETGRDPTATNYLANFGPQFYQDKPWYGDASPTGSSNYQTISAGGLDLLFLNLAVDTPKVERDWAQQVLDQNPDRWVVLSTHRYLQDYRLVEGRYDDFEFGFLEQWYTDPGQEGITSEELFQQFVKTNSKIFMVLNGHCDGEYRQTSINDEGRPVFEILADYQTFSANGGDGWMRLMTFQREGNVVTIDTDTYSPTLDRFRTTEDGFQETLAAVPIYAPLLCDALGYTPEQCDGIVQQLTANEGAGLWQLYADGRRDPSFTLVFEVPEPGVLAMLGVGALVLALGGIRRLRR